MDFPGPTPKQARAIWFAVTALAVTLTLVIIGAVFWGFGLVLNRLSPVLLPLAVAGVIAYLLDPVVDWLVARRIPRRRAIVCVFVFALLVVVGVLGSIIPQVVVESRQLAGRIPGYVQRLQERGEHWLNHPPAPLVTLTRLLPAGLQERLAVARESTVTNAPTEGSPPPPPTTPPLAPDAPWWAKALDPASIKSAGGWLGAVLPAIGEWLFGQATKVASWLGLLVGLALVPVYTFYLLLEKRGIERQWTDYLPLQDSRLKDELVFVLRNINDCLVVFFRGQVLVALCDGVLYTIGFLGIGLPYAMLLGLMATMLTMIPFLGAITTCSAALVIALVQFGDWKHLVLVLGVFGVVQLLEALVFQPKIIGHRVGLHPMTIIIGLMVGTTLLGGILGGILAIPLTAALRTLMLRYVWQRPAA